MFKLSASAVLLAVSLGAISAVAQAPPPFEGKLLLKPSRSHNKCVTASGNNNGATVSLQDCTGNPNQKWVFSNGQIKVFGDKCLDVVGGNHSNGAQVQIHTCQNGNANQLWDYSKWDNTITWWKNGKCLDLSNGDASSGAKPHLWDCYYWGQQPNQVWNVGYLPSQLPSHTQQGQFGTNTCGGTSSQDSNCQTAWINSAEDFCLFAPPHPDSAIGDTEHEAVAWCTKSGRGTRTIPDGTLKGVHFVKTPTYVQISGVGDFTKLNIKAGDYGGELDNRGATGVGNPAGGLIFGNTFGANTQYHEWTTFISEKQFCIRACIGPDATKLCNHIYDEMGCEFNIPANYEEGKFESCDGDVAEPMGLYKNADGSTSTWKQHTSPTPPPHPAPASSNCVPLPTITSSPVRRNVDAHRRTLRGASVRARDNAGARAHPIKSNNNAN